MPPVIHAKMTATDCSDPGSAVSGIVSAGVLTASTGCLFYMVSCKNPCRHWLCRAHDMTTFDERSPGEQPGGSPLPCCIVTWHGSVILDRDLIHTRRLAADCPPRTSTCHRTASLSPTDACATIIHVFMTMTGDGTSSEHHNPPLGVSVVVPVYNGEGTLRQLVDRLESTLGGASSRLEIIMVNDGSRDGSWAVICQLARDHYRVRGVNLMRNYGQHNALLCGIRMAQNEVIVTMDDDLQHPPEEVPKLLAKLAEGYDVVYGTPAQEQHGLFRDLASQVTKLALQSAMGAETARKVSAFRAFRTLLRNAFAQYRSPSVSIDVLLTWATTHFGAISVRHDPRRIGASNYSFRKLVSHALDMMTGFSTWPLQLATVIGLTFSIVGLAVLTYVLLNYLIRGGSIPGFTFLASMVAIFSGAQLFTLGIIGEYLARMYKRMMDRPPYVIGDIANGDGTDEY